MATPPPSQSRPCYKIYEKPVKDAKKPADFCPPPFRVGNNEKYHPEIHPHG